MDFSSANRKRNYWEDREHLPPSKRYCGDHKPAHSADHSQRGSTPGKSIKRQSQAFEQSHSVCYSTYLPKRQHFHDEYPCLQGNLHQLAFGNPKKAIYELNDNFEEFKHLIYRFPQEKDDILDFIMIFSRIIKVDKNDRSQKPLDTIVDALLNQVTSGGFFLSLQQYIGSMPTFGSGDERTDFLEILQKVISIFSALLERNPTQAAKCLPIDVCVGTAQQLSVQDYYFKEVDEMAQRLLQKRNKICMTIYESKAKSPCTNKASIVLPSPEELNSKSLLMKRKVTNIIDAPFPSVEEYLKIQLELLRDDFINPLRSALLKCQEDSKAIRYTDVKFEPKETYTTSGTIAYKLSFQTSRKVNWKRSQKSLKYGSLLCLLDDKSVLYATVEERDVGELEKGLLTVQLQGHDGHSLPTSTFKMIESPVYFKSYAPVIEKLHKLEPEHLCFSKYLVHLQKTMEKPLYLRSKREIVFNLKGVVCNCKDDDECIHEQVHVLDRQSWSASLSRAILDDSQKDALHRALTSELALIQGPPGTGKTYVGLKIIHTLLQNRHLWEYEVQSKSPIMVVCYTNHALDQFLEGLIDLQLPKTSIVRVGGRCNNDRVKRFTLQQRLREYRDHHGYRHRNPKILSSMHKIVEALNEFIHGECKFMSSNCKIYASFLTPDIIDRFQYHCQIEFPCVYETTGSALDFAYWLDEGIAHRVDNYDPYQSTDFALDDNRQAYDDSESDTIEVVRVLGKEGLKEFMQKLGGVLPFQDRQAEGYFESQDTQSMGLYYYGRSRLQLYKYCLLKLLDACQRQHKYNIDEQSVHEMKIKETKTKCLQQASVIGLTTTGATIHSDLLSKVKSKIIIVEEAAEVLEPQILATLTKHTQHLILIGDHKQLRPKTNDHIIGVKHKLEISMFERLVQNSLPLTTLSVQHRMRPEISQMVSNLFYQGSLLDHEITQSRPSVKGMKHNVYFVNHNEYENSNPDLVNLKSYSNEHEAAFLASLCNYLIQQGYKSEQITIITPYVGQLLELRSQLKNKAITPARVVTLDNYQGEENDIILLSLVRGNKVNKIGFLKSENRICVALSRAKCGLYCIGNFNVLRKCPKTRLWSSIVTDLESKGLIGNELQLQCIQHNNETKVSKAEDFEKIPDGGCDQDCGKRLTKCNHCCPRKCHPDDPDHVLNQCEQSCPERCAAGEHWCPLKCYQGCNKCTVKVKKEIPGCNHYQYVPCHMNPKKWICQKPCVKKLPCEHNCKRKCGEPCTTKCEEFAIRKLICGHKAKVRCNLDDYQAATMCTSPCRAELACEHLCSGNCGICRQGRLHKPCSEKCTRILLCGHPCSGKCAKNCPPCKKACAYTCPHGKCGNICHSLCRPCPHRCKWMCLHKKCTKRCGELCNRERCDKPCRERLECGHPCLGLCSKPCPPVCHECDTVKDRVELILGDEHDKSAGYRYIKLNDCPHIFAVDSLDQYMDQKDDSTHQIVQWKGCPICKTPVIKTMRYANVTKQILSDLNEVKKKEVIFLSTNQRKQMKCELLRIPLEQLESIGLSVPTFLSAQANLKPSSESTDADIQKVYVLFKSAYDILQAHKDIDQLLEEVHKSKNQMAILTEKRLMLFLFQAGDFIGWIKTHQACDKLTDQMISDIYAEHRRFLLLQKFLELEHSMIMNTRVDQENEDLREVQSTYEGLFAKLSDQEYQTKLELLTSIQKRQPTPLTKEARKMIISAMSAKRGSWYKCPQGHYYNIGQCGGAMEIGKCPDCGSQIGGQHHRLIETNEHAGDFDESNFAAWSEGANLLNYEY